MVLSVGSSEVVPGYPNARLEHAPWNSFVVGLLSEVRGIPNIYSESVWGRCGEGGRARSRLSYVLVL